MTICEFCLQYANGACGIGLKIPTAMRCREFAPGLEKFCSDPADFVSPGQIVEMARFFGIDKTELKRVKVVAEKGQLIPQPKMALPQESDV